jgi:hypothetical protein
LTLSAKAYSLFDYMSNTQYIVHTTYFGYRI